MEKKRYKKPGRDKRERIGLDTRLLDRDGNTIKTGDRVRIHGRHTYDGVVLWHRDLKCYGIFMGLWYGDHNPYDADCYGKFIRIPQDNGMRMEIEPINGEIPKLVKGRVC